MREAAEELEKVGELVLHLQTRLFQDRTQGERPRLTLRDNG